jgi:hypothetical protein
MTLLLVPVVLVAMGTQTALVVPVAVESSTLAVVAVVAQVMQVMGAQEDRAVMGFRVLETEPLVLAAEVAAEVTILALVTETQGAAAVVLAY